MMRMKYGLMRTTTTPTEKIEDVMSIERKPNRHAKRREDGKVKKGPPSYRPQWKCTPMRAEGECAECGAMIGGTRDNGHWIGHHKKYFCERCCPVC